ncbi:uncharacterized protein LOC131647771 [Vicia villosa]|uniref:uncharacterized protein LOC131647771 n=1 Tax=Vicia villosa TaxID=3911 RepID=UPI00273BF441|nr:uncharacterized protein LOC131647771 [Vicia villosa]
MWSLFGGMGFLSIMVLCGGWKTHKLHHFLRMWCVLIENDAVSFELEPKVFYILFCRFFRTEDFLFYKQINHFFHFCRMDAFKRLLPFCVHQKPTRTSCQTPLFLGIGEQGINAKVCFIHVLLNTYRHVTI